MKFKKYTLPFLLICFALSMAQAQFTISGTILDDTGETLTGATVQLKGTTLGTATGIDGKYQLDVPSNSGTLVISSIGFKATEVAIDAANPKVDIIMEVFAGLLQEATVIGYGTIRKEALTGAVSSLNAEDIEGVPLGSVEQALAGNIAGLQAVMSNGQPGANVSIRIRGQGSISASSEPLYVIDGIPVISGNLTSSAETSNPLATINPNDIESVTVLKDAASTAIYGSRGANGVILITTKSGKTGKPRITLSTQIGTNDWAVSKDKRLRGLTATEYTDLYLEGWMNQGETIEQATDRFNSQFPDPQTGLPAVDIIPNGSGGYTLGTVRVDNRWIDELSRNGLNQSYDLTVSGGTDVFKYYASGSYFKQEAPIIYSQLDRYSSRLNLSVQATEKLKFTNNLNVSRTGQQGMNDETRWANPLYNGYLLAPVIPIRDAQGRFYGDHKSFFMGGNNPIGSLSGDDDQEWTMIRILDHLTGEYTLIDGLTLKSAWAVDLLNYAEFYFRNARYGDGRNDNGYGQETTRNNVNWLGTQTLAYDFTAGLDHNINLLAGYEAQKNSQRSATAAAIGYPNPNLRTLASAANPDLATSDLTEFSFNSVFFRANYNYSYKYYLSGSIRRDGSSRFGVNNRFGTFWSVGASWRLDQEAFLVDASWLSTLKLRASYGVTGNAGIGNYDHIPTFSFSGIEYDGQPGGAPGQIGNIDLTWEQSKSFNIGVDFDLFNRLEGTIEYFDRESDNLLLDVPVSRTTGFVSLTQNFGAMKNNGIELTLNFNAINKGDFFWSLGGNISFIENKITKLDEEFIAGTKIRREGLDYQSYYTYEWAGVSPDDGSPLWYTDSTRTNTTSNSSDAERFVSGKSATPSFFGGLTTTFSWKGFSIDARFVYSWDNYLFDASGFVIQGDGRFTPRSQTHLVLSRWKKAGDVTDVPKFSWGNRSGSNLPNSTRWIHDGSHFRLRNLTVAYFLPGDLVKTIGLGSARIYFRGTNLLTWTREKDLYLDPEAAFSGVVTSPVPNLKTAAFGIDLSF